MPPSLSRRGTPASLACVNWRAGGTVLQALIPLDIGGTQIRQARELLGWPASYLALRAKISTAAIDRAETGGESAVTGAHWQAILAVLDRAGVEFTAGATAGVRLGERKK